MRKTKVVLETKLTCPARSFWLLTENSYSHSPSFFVPRGKKKGRPGVFATQAAAEKAKALLLRQLQLELEAENGWAPDEIDEELEYANERYRIIKMEAFKESSIPEPSMIRKPATARRDGHVDYEDDF